LLHEALKDSGLCVTEQNGPSQIPVYKLTGEYVMVRNTKPGGVLWNTLMFIPAIILPIPLESSWESSMEVELQSYSGDTIARKTVDRNDMRVVVYSVWSYPCGRKAKMEAHAKAATALAMEMLMEQQQ
jgi:hypothetical protein